MLQCGRVLLLHRVCHNRWFAIQATSSFPDCNNTIKLPLISELDLAFVGSEIIDIEYYDSDWEHSHIAIIENSVGERILYDQSSSAFKDGVSLIARTGMGTINAENLTSILGSGVTFWISDAPGKLTRLSLENRSQASVLVNWEFQILLT